jgi:hypothetical protein
MNDHFPVLGQTPQYKMCVCGVGGGGGGKLVVWTQTSPLSEMKVKLSHILWRTAFHML